MKDSHLHRYRLVDVPGGHFAFVTRNNTLVATFLPASEPTQRRIIAVRFPDAVEDLRLFPAFEAAVRFYFSGMAVQFDIPLALDDVPPFHHRVYEQCRRIPFGRTASYQDLARAAGNERAVRAVGSAMARNRLPLVVPCHRVLRADGSIGGFSSPEGIEQKKRMLRLEGIDLRNGRIVHGPKVQTDTAVA